MKTKPENILAPHFQNEDAAREYLDAMRWPDGTVCPHCGLVGEAYKLTPKEKNFEEIKATRKRIRKPRKGLWKCAGCRKQFTVTVKTIFEDSHINGVGYPSALLKQKGNERPPAYEDAGY